MFFVPVVAHGAFPALPLPAVGFVAATPAVLLFLAAPVVGSWSDGRRSDVRGGARRVVASVGCLLLSAALLALAGIVSLTAQAGGGDDGADGDGADGGNGVEGGGLAAGCALVLLCCAAVAVGCVAAPFWALHHETQPAALTATRCARRRRRRGCVRSVIRAARAHCPLQRV